MKTARLASLTIESHDMQRPRNNTADYAYVHGYFDSHQAVKSLVKGFIDREFAFLHNGMV
jgi:hypothetical protein